MATLVRSVPGVGPKTADYLEQKGISSAEQLIEQGFDILVSAPGFSEARATTVMTAARAIVLGETPAPRPNLSTPKKKVIKKAPAKKGSTKKVVKKKAPARKTAKKKTTAKKASVENVTVIGKLVHEAETKESKKGKKTKLGQKLKKKTKEKLEKLKKKIKDKKKDKDKKNKDKKKGKDKDKKKKKGKSKGKKRKS